MEHDSLEHRIDEGEKEIFERLEQLTNYDSIPDVITGRYTISEGIYKIDHDIHVRGGTLNIDSNVTLEFGEGKGIYVYQGKLWSGEIHIGGTIERPVILQSSAAFWEGLTITNSKRYNSIHHAIIRKAKKNNGGGILLNDSRLIFDNGIIEDCEASTGGGICADNSILQINDSIFQRNSAMHGGGVYNEHSETSMTRSKIIDNAATMCGAGICNHYSRVSIKSSLIGKNTQSIQGGGLNDYRSNTQIEDTIIKDNDAKEGGAMFITEKSQNKTFRSTITANKALSGGGGVYIKDNSTIMLIESNIVENEGGTGGGIFNSERCIVRLYSSIISGNKAVWGGGIWHNAFDSFTEMKDSTIIKNTATLREGAGGGLDIYMKFEDNPYTGSDEHQNRLLIGKRPGLGVHMKGKNTIENNSPYNIHTR